MLRNINIFLFAWLGCNDAAIWRACLYHIGPQLTNIKYTCKQKIIMHEIESLVQCNAMACLPITCPLSLHLLVAYYRLCQQQQLAGHVILHTLI